jgi:hypothetical protein
MFTKKYLSLIGLVFLLLIASSIGVAPASAATNVSVSPSTQTVSQGESFSINVSIEPDTAIAGAQCNLQFNSSLVQVNSITEGELFKQNGTDTSFSPGTIDNTAGVVAYVYGYICKTEGAPMSVSTPGTFAIISLTASNTAAGTSPLDLVDRPPISVRLSDPEGNPVPIKVVNGIAKVNRAPVLDLIGDKNVGEGQTLTFTISASDLDDDPLTYSASNLPSGASFDPTTRTFSWTPSYDQVGTYPNVHFEVSDGHLTDFEDITITVNDVNRAPVLNPIGDKTVDEGQTLTFTISASDLDDDPLTYSASNLPGGASFDPATKTFSWTSSYDQVGTYPNVHFEVSDGHLTDFEDITITVNDPVLNPIGDKTVDEGQTLTFTISASDLDDDSLTYSASNLPSGASFNPATKTFSWTPNYNQAETYPNVHFEVSDGHLTDFEDITITVNNAYPPYDINKDGIIDICDLTMVGQHYDEENPTYDLNHGGVVDVGDLVMISQHFGEVST